MHYLHLLPAAAVTGVSLSGSNGFKRRHGAKLTSGGRGAASLYHNGEKKNKSQNKNQDAGLFGALFLFGNADERSASTGGGLLEQNAAPEDGCSGRDAARKGHAV